MNKITLALVAILFIILFLEIGAIAFENEMEEAEEIIAYATRRLEYIRNKLTEPIPSEINDLLGDAEEYLESAREAFKEGKNRKAIQEATSSIELIKDAEKILNEEPLIEIFSFEESRPENNLIPPGWFYTKDSTSLNTEMDSDLNTWDVDNFSLVSESYFGDNSILLNTYKTFCCPQSGYIRSKTIKIDPSKTYYLEFYTKTNYTLYSTNKGNVGYHAYLLIFFDDTSNNLISEFYTEWNQTNISLENLGASPPSSELLNFNDTQNGWKKVKIRISNLNPSIDNVKIVFAEYYPENSVNVLIDDISIYAG